MLASSKRAWTVTEKPSGEMSASPMDHVTEAIKLFSGIDVEIYFVDRVTRKRIDNSLALLQSQLSETNKDAPNGRPPYSRS